MHKLGYAREERAFSPHLTLGRVNDSASPAERQTLSDLLTKTQVGLLGTVPAHELILFRSDLLPGGAVYTALARVPLGAATLESGSDHCAHDNGAGAVLSLGIMGPRLTTILVWHIAHDAFPFVL